MFRKTSEMMEGLCFAISVTGLSRPNFEDDVLIKNMMRTEEKLTDLTSLLLLLID
jgi:hypothetical protein